MNRTNSKYSKFLLIFVSICLVFSFLFLPCCLLLNYAFYQDENKTDHINDVRVFVADDQPVTKRYELKPCTDLYFFDMLRTEFVNAYPKLTIVNDTQYYAEITTNAELYDLLNVGRYDYYHWTAIRFETENYTLLEKDYEDDSDEYAFRVDCTVFEVVVHAPIQRLHIGVRTEFDFDAPTAEKISVWLESGGNGRIFNVNTDTFYLKSEYSAQIKAEGTVNETVQIIADNFSDLESYFDMQGLSAKEWKTDLWGNCTLVGNDFIETKEISKVQYLIHPLVCLIVVGQFLFWLIWEIKLIKRQIRKKQSQDN